VVQQARLLLSEDDDPAGPVSKAFEQRKPPRWGRRKGSLSLSANPV
jgi:hypothetical protein